MLRCILFFVFLSPALALASQWNINKMMSVKLIEDVMISPNGHEAAFDELRFFKDNQSWHQSRQIYLANGSTIALTSKGDNANPNWSPDGQYLAYLSADDGKTHINVMNIKTKQSWSLNNIKGDISSIRWSHHGDKIAFVKQNKITHQKKPLAPIVVGKKILHCSNLYIVSLDKNKQALSSPTQLTNYSKNTHCEEIKGFSFSKDDSKIAFAHIPSGNDATWDLGKISAIDIASKKNTPISANEKTS